jgi:hypothetical protein
MLNIIQNTIGAIRRVGESVVRAGLKMWLPFTKAEPLGEELVVNGDFSHPTDGWDFGASTDIVGGKLVCTSSSAYNSTSQSISMKAGTYIVTYTIDSISGGVIYFGFDGVNGVNRNTSGTYTEYLEVPSNSSNLYIVPTANGIEFEISNVSVEEYVQETPDISGNDNNAILKTGKALVFAGNDSVETSFPSSKTIKTIAFWIYPTHSASHEVLFNLGITNIPIDNLGDRVIELDHLTIHNRQRYPLNFDVYIDGAYRGETNWNGDNPTLELNQWQRVVLVNSNGTSTVNDTFDVAYTGSGSHGRFKMSDLQIHGADWTTDDIAYDYANPQKLVTDNASSSVTLNDLHAWWHMSEGDGTIAFDSAPLIGKELVTNGDFSTDSNWSKTNATILNGIANISTAGDLAGIVQSSVTTSGKLYKFSFEITSIETLGQGLSLVSGGLTSAILHTFTSIGKHTIYFTATSTTIAIKRKSGATDISIDNISVKEVYNIDGETHHGNSLGATYDDAQERIPQLGMMNWSKGSNLLEYSEDFSEWTNVNSGTGSQVVLTENQLAPDGTLTATKMFFDKGTGSTNSDFSILQAFFTSQSNTASVYLRSDTAQKIMIRNSSTFQLIDVSTDWVRINKTDSGGSIQIGLRSGYVSGEPNTSTIYVWGAQVESGASATAYRRTNGTAVTDATLISCATDSQKDILGNAVRAKGSGFNLDGTGYAEITEEVFNVGTGAFTISAWAKYKFIYQNSSHNAIFVTGTGLGFNSVASLSSTYPDTTNRGFLFRIGQETIGTNHSVSLVEGNWYHVVGVKKADGDMNLYVNGNLQDDTEANSDSLRNDQNKYIGEDANATYDRFYHERIDDVKFYNRELSSDEIEQNYNATRSGHNN